mmetsp:Transcript_13062/g.32802  ORF Transcript_13062/g.32802 Transcript_13062/m.32802 type:complete len:159 (-) Transcript_13062:235-711(-)
MLNADCLPLPLPLQSNALHCIAFFSSSYRKSIAVDLEALAEAKKQSRRNQTRVHPSRAALAAEAHARWVADQSRRAILREDAAHGDRVKRDGDRQRRAANRVARAREVAAARALRRQWLEGQSAKWIREDDLDDAIKRAINNPKSLAAAINLWTTKDN